MADILVRGLERDTLGRLKSRAKRHGRSLQREARLILERAVSADDAARTIDELRVFRRSLGRRFGDSAALIREDRER